MKHIVWFVLLLCQAGLPAIQAQVLSNESMSFGGDTRTYLKYIPEGYDEGVAAPVVLNFHGGSGNANEQLGMADMRALADADQFILLYPDALPDPNDGGSTNWQVVTSGDLPFTLPNPHDDIGFVDALIDEVSAEHNVDLNRVYALGYSNGGGFTFDLACRLNHRIAAVGVVARTMYIESFESCNVTHPTAVVTILGTDDFASPYDGLTYEGTLYFASAEDSHQLWVDANALDSNPELTALENIATNDGSTVDLFSWTRSDECMELQHYRVNGGGHDWPGTFGNMDIVAHETIWNFVKEYGLEGHLDCSSSTVVNEDVRTESYTVFPNPAHDRVTLSTHFERPWTYTVTNLQGQVIQSGQSSLHQVELPMDKVSSGMYWVQMGTESEISPAFPLVVRH